MSRKDGKDGKGLPATGTSSADDVAAFLKAATHTVPRPVGRGRLAFALDATFSRQPTWDLACGLQAELFAAAADLGGLDVKLIYYRGASECKASGWVEDPLTLGRLMGTIACQGGQTQIGRVLGHLEGEVERSGLKAAVFVGDALEEDADALCHKAGRLGVMGLKLFIFQEGYDQRVEAAFREMARLTGGAWCRFEPGAGDQLRSLLRAVAAYAAGGRPALQASREQGARLLLSALKS
ncbi:VWA domain-containing protein [Aquabacter sp. L1I39]|uniref:VWA domain-containing protein n=1 Tax=Aquabacter sp. L1I39 TaxID=2820278 RepID=UPI001ADB2078|nr:VWA domain-containing protein [Aquabacter sp. L1I39]QTL05402.1 VWA domain-containing protein [Aquabacter sp. L1I39]